MKRIITVFFLFPFIITAGCGVISIPGQKEEPAGLFIAAEWNVQALFDGQEEGNEYDEYREASGWMAEKYTARITAFSQALTQMIWPDNTANTAASKTVFPDLIGLLELENAGVLEDIARFDPQNRGYYWTGFTVIPGSSLGLGVLSRFPITDIRSHSITVGKDTAPRPILETRVEPNGKPLVFLLCHWKSKLGGEDVTEALRRSSARVVARRLKELKETEPETPVIIMGDLNENHDEFYRRSGKVLTALLPDDPDAAVIAALSTTVGLRTREEYLVLSGEIPPRANSFGESIPALYSPWMNELTDGSYFYRDEWETIDHALLSEELFNNAGWTYNFSRVANHAPFTGSDGRPGAYNPRHGRGLSDHLPLLLYLRYVE